MKNYDIENIIKHSNEIALQAATDQLTKLILSSDRIKVIDEKGFEIDELLDVCGGAYIKFTDKRNSFYKQYRDYMIKEEGIDKYSSILDMFRFQSIGRQEQSVNEAAAFAVYKYLKDLGAKVTFNTYID